MRTLIFSIVVVYALVLLAPVSNTSQAKGGDSNDWKGWHEWKWEQPEFEEIERYFSDGGTRTWGMKVEFFSVWDERFDQYPTASDGFVVLHIGSEMSLDDVVLTVVSYNGMTILGDTAKEIEHLEGGIVESYFIPVKAPGEKGEFEIQVGMFAGHVLEGTKGLREIIFVIKKHRRDISWRSLKDYVGLIRERRLSAVEKRPGAEFYRPIDFCDPSLPLPDDAVVVEDPMTDGLHELLLASKPPPGATDELYDHPEHFLDVSREEAHSESYEFRGKLYYPEHSTNVFKPVVNARIWVFDDDTLEFPPKEDDFICEAFTNDQGEFYCAGTAEDRHDLPDPYVTYWPLTYYTRLIYCPAPHQDCYTMGSSVSWPQMWLREGTPDRYDYSELPGGSYILTPDAQVSDPDPVMQTIKVRQFRIMAYISMAWKFDIQSWFYWVPDAVWLGEHKVHHPADDTRYTRYCGVSGCSGRIYIHGDDANNFSTVNHEFGHSLHNYIIGYDNSLPGPEVLSHGICQMNQDPGFAFKEGFANAHAMIVSLRPIYCGGCELPWEGTPNCSVYNRTCGWDCGPGCEGSNVHFGYDGHDSLEWYFNEMSSWIAAGHPVAEFPYGWAKGVCCATYKEVTWEGVQQALCKKYEGDPVNYPLYCPNPQDHPYGWQGEYLQSKSDKAHKGASESLVANAIWDLHDGWGGNDDSCPYHFWGAWRQACDASYMTRDIRSWGFILYVMEGNTEYGGNPRNYLELIEGIADTISADCEERNYLRTVSRFNGITLDGVFGWPHKWESCDKFPPIEEAPCAATEAVVDAVEGGVDGVSITPEEGEDLLDRIRRIRDEFLLKSERGKYYAFMYSTCSDEIIEGIIGNPNITLAALDLMQNAAQKIDNLEYYLSSGESPIDEEFAQLVAVILTELKSHTSSELLNGINFVEADMEVVQGMTVQEILDYFEWSE